MASPRCLGLVVAVVVCWESSLGCLDESGLVCSGLLVLIFAKFSTNKSGNYFFLINR
jgi:hypothetical protein